MSRTKRNKDVYSDWHKGRDEWKQTRDKKRWHKPSSWFKKMKRAESRAEDHAVLQKAKFIDPEEIDFPKHPMNNKWEWT